MNMRLLMAREPVSMIELDNPKPAKSHEIRGSIKLTEAVNPQPVRLLSDKKADSDKKEPSSTGDEHKSENEREAKTRCSDNPGPVKESNEMEPRVPGPVRESNEMESRVPVPASESNEMKPRVPGPVRESNEMESRVPVPASESNEMKPHVSGPVRESNEMGSRVPVPASESNEMESRVPVPARESNKMKPHVSTLAAGESERRFGSPGGQIIHITGCKAEAGSTMNIILNREEKSEMPNETATLPYLIKQYRNDYSNIFVSTEGLDACVNTLLEHRALMITGAPGSGKTMIAQQLMVKLWDLKKCHPFKPIKPSEYSKNCNPEIPQCFHIDDVFGSTNFVEGKYIAWVSLAENMKDHLRSQNTFIIFTSRDNIFNENSSDVKNHDIFSHVINLSDDKFKLTEMNMHDIFDNHARENQLGIEYKDIVNQEEATVDSIQTKLEPMGYPQRVHLLCLMKDVSKEAQIRYFRHPMEFLSNIIASFREKDHLSYCVLILLLMNDGKLPHSFFHHSNKSSEQVQKCLDICRLPASTPMRDLHATAQNLCRSFLIEHNDCFATQHESIMEATTLDFGRNYPTDILDRCSIQFLLERVFTKDSAPPDNEYVVILPEYLFPQLSARLIKEIQGCLRVKVVMHKNWLIQLYHWMMGDAASSDGDAASSDGDACTMRSISAYHVFRDPAFNCVFQRHMYVTSSFNILLTSSSPYSQHPTFLFLAAASGQDALIREVLSSRDVQRLPGFMDHLDRVMYAACWSGSAATVGALLVAGARTDCRTAHAPDKVRYGWWDEPQTCTTLMHAAYSGSVEVLRLVLDHLQQQRVNVVEHADIRDHWARTALYWWVRGGRGADVLHMLLDAGADVNARSKEGRTALWRSAGVSDEAAVRALLKAGAEVNLRCYDSQSELIEIRDGRVWFTMKANPDVNDEVSETALHLSAKRGDEAIARLLVAAGANVHLRASTPSWYNEVPGWLHYTDKTPLDVAVLYNRTAVTDFLLSIPST